MLEKIKRLCFPTPTIRTKKKRTILAIIFQTSNRSLRCLRSNFVRSNVRLPFSPAPPFQAFAPETPPSTDTEIGYRTRLLRLLMPNIASTRIFHVGGILHATFTTFNAENFSPISRRKK